MSDDWTNKVLLTAFAVVVALLVYGAFRRDTYCKLSNDQLHHWSAWTNMWEKPNYDGYMSQGHTCNNCGYFETQIH